MQTAAKRLSGGDRARRRQGGAYAPHLAAADDVTLLDALPIAAALDWNQADCLRAGPIADLLTAYFKDPSKPGELDFRDGEGVSAVYFRIKLASLPRQDGEPQRCLMSVVDRTVEVQAERALRAE